MRNVNLRFCHCFLHHHLLQRPKVLLKKDSATAWNYKQTLSPTMEICLKLIIKALRYFQKIISCKCLGILQDMAQFSHGKTVVCSVCSKNLMHYEKRLLQKILFFRYCSSGLFKNFLKLTRKHLYRSLYLMKLLATSLELYRQRQPDAGVFL